MTAITTNSSISVNAWAGSGLRNCRVMKEHLRQDRTFVKVLITYINGVHEAKVLADEVRVAAKMAFPKPMTQDYGMPRTGGYLDSSTERRARTLH